MLADTRRKDAVVGSVRTQLLDHVLRLERAAFVLRVTQRVIVLPLADLRDPRGDVRRLVLLVLGAHRLDELLDHRADVADDRHVGAPHLAELGGIDVDVNDLGVGCERRDLARDAVVEARPERDEQIGVLHRRDRGVVAVHARHAEAQRVLVGDATASHQCRDDGNAGDLGQLAQLARRASALRMPPPA